MTVVAIHQPNFFPWLGYFDKIGRSDVFVVLDDVQFPSRGNRVHRVELLIQGRRAWATAPVLKARGSSGDIRDMRIDDSRGWRPKLLRTIEQNYRRAPHFGDVYPLVSELVQTPIDRLGEYNERVVRRISRELGLGGEIVLSSELATTSRATERLVELTRAVGGTAYLSGDGAGGYQDEERLRTAGLDLRHQYFEPPDYPQLADQPVGGLSVIDALMNCGIAGTAALLSRE